MSYRWMIAGGGTGGHVTPALALGEVLREELPLGIIAVRESRAEAMYGVVRRTDETPAVDLVRAARIPAQLDDFDLERAPRITWHLSGVAPRRFELDRNRGSWSIPVSRCVQPQ